MQYLALCDGLFVCDLKEKSFSKMIYGKGWMKLDSKMYVSFILGEMEYFSRIDKEKAIEMVLRNGGKKEDV